MSSRQLCGPARPQLETLEDRLVPTTVSLFSFDGVDMVYIQGTSEWDTVRVNDAGSWYEIEYNAYGGMRRAYYHESQVDMIYFVGGDGYDHFMNNTALRSQAYGEGGVDFLYGGSGHDYLDGGAGTDYLYGRGGHDTLRGGSGNDYLYGGAGHDDLFGGSGNDWLYGGSGYDYLFGESDHDWLFGGADSDRLYGGSGDDHLYGEGGADWISGGSGFDRAWWGDGAWGDTIVWDNEFINGTRVYAPAWAGY